jgi:hypothetical protein
MFDCSFGFTYKSKQMVLKLFIQITDRSLFKSMYATLTFSIQVLKRKISEATDDKENESAQPLKKFTIQSGGRPKTYHVAAGPSAPKQPLSTIRQETFIAIKNAASLSSEKTEKVMKVRSRIKHIQ